ncbi:hypothetical protein V9T40_005639 [Parthenolecanium corni]|uniref:Uncharacterized protein n=1 Tax=Parthenolecanium corni TaxID=536013 RepID=A0AAN9TUK7_9HEMI
MQELVSFCLSVCLSVDRSQQRCGRSASHCDQQAQTLRYAVLEARYCPPPTPAADVCENNLADAREHSVKGRAGRAIHRDEMRTARRRDAKPVVPFGAEFGACWAECQVPGFAVLCLLLSIVVRGLCDCCVSFLLSRLAHGLHTGFQT